MTSTSEGEKHTPPRLALRLLEMVLRPVIAENIIGDLEEEYHARRKHKGLRAATWWFWTQSLGMLRTSLKEFCIRPLQLFSNKHKGAIAFGVALGCFFSLSLTSLLLNQRDSTATLPVPEHGNSPRNTTPPIITHSEWLYEPPPASVSDSSPPNTFSNKPMARHRVYAQRPVLTDERQIPIYVTTSVKDDQDLDKGLVRAFVDALEKKKRFKVLIASQRIVVPRDAYEIHLSFDAKATYRDFHATLYDTEGKEIWNDKNTNCTEGQQGTFTNLLLAGIAASTSRTTKDDLTYLY